MTNKRNKTKEKRKRNPIRNVFLFLLLVVEERRKNHSFQSVVELNEKNVSKPLKSVWLSLLEVWFKPVMDVVCFLSFLSVWNKTKQKTKQNKKNCAITITQKVCFFCFVLFFVSFVVLFFGSIKTTTTTTTTPFAGSFRGHLWEYFCHHHNLLFFRPRTSFHFFQLFFCFSSNNIFCLEVEGLCCVFFVSVSPHSKSTKKKTSKHQTKHTNTHNTPNTHNTHNTANTPNTSNTLNTPNTTTTLLTAFPSLSHDGLFVRESLDQVIPEIQKMSPVKVKQWVFGIFFCFSQFFGFVFCDQFLTLCFLMQFLTCVFCDQFLTLFSQFLTVFFFLQTSLLDGLWTSLSLLRSDERPSLWTSTEAQNWNNWSQFFLLNIMANQQWTHTFLTFLVLWVDGCDRAPYKHWQPQKGDYFELWAVKNFSDSKNHSTRTTHTNEKKFCCSSQKKKNWTSQKIMLTQIIKIKLPVLLHQKSTVLGKNAK